MAVKIRLRRMGSNKKPFFRIVATDERRPNQGRFLEALGWYDPKKKGVNYLLKLERIEHWAGQGAILSDTVRSLVTKQKKSAHRAAAPAPEPPGTP